MEPGSPCGLWATMARNWSWVRNCFFLLRFETELELSSCRMYIWTSTGLKKYKTKLNHIKLHLAICPRRLFTKLDNDQHKKVWVYYFQGCSRNLLSMRSSIHHECFSLFIFTTLVGMVMTLRWFSPGVHSQPLCQILDMSHCPVLARLVSDGRTS